MLGKLIKAYIEKNGLKQKNIAEDAGLPPQTLNDILNERRRIEATEYFNICKALRVSVDYFANILKDSKCL